MDVNLYAWQKECLKAWFAAGTHGTVHVVTGAGKTVMAAAAIVKLKEKLSAPIRVRIVVPTKVLLRQWSDTLIRLLSVNRREMGYYYGQRQDRPDCSYMIYVVNSARYALARHVLADWEQGFHVLLIADECHHYDSPENRKIFDFLPSLREHGLQYHSLGLSATLPQIGPESVLSKALGKEIYRYGFAEAVKMRTVSPFSILQVAVSFTLKEREEYERWSDQMALLFKRLSRLCPGLEKRERGAFFGTLNRLASGEDAAAGLAKRYLLLAYRRRETVCMAEARISCALDIVQRLPSQTKLLIFSERIAQAEQMYAALRERYPGQAGCYHSQSGELARENAMEAFRNGRLRILVTCRALDEGMDVPEVSVGIVLSGAVVRRQRVQRLGRLLRTKPGKDMACLYYLYVEKTQEESVYFPDEEQDDRMGRLFYCQTEAAFINPAYEERAAGVLREMAAAGIDMLRQKEARRCLEEGLVRPDWLLTEAQCEERLSTAVDMRERNYWLCMREMAKKSDCI